MPSTGRIASQLRALWRAVCERPVLATVLILTMATLLRLWHYDFDRLMYNMPLTHDSYAKLLMARRVAQGTLQPMHYWQPYFLAYTLGAIYWVAGILGEREVLTLWKLGSLYMISLSVLTTGIMVLIGKRLFRDWRPALLGALLFAVIPVNVMGSRYLKEDIPLMFVSCLAWLWILRLLENGGWWDYLVAGLLVGVATGAKYAALGMIPFLVAAHMMRVWRSEEGSRIRRSLLSPRLGAALLLIPIGFLLFNPYVIPEWHLFREALDAQAEYAGRGHSDGTAITGWNGWWTFYLRYAIYPGMTWPLASAALLGLPLLLWKQRHAAVYLTGVWALYAYFSIESSPAKPFPFFARYLHPLFPLLCLFAAFGILSLLSLARGKAQRALCLLFAWSCILTPLAKTCVLNDNLRKDTRVVASHWIDEHLEPGSTIFLDDGYYSPRPSSNRFDVHYLHRFYHCSWEEMKESGADYVVMNSFRCDRYEAARPFSSKAQNIYDYYQEIQGMGQLIKEFHPRLRWQSYAFHNPVIWIYRMPWADGGSDTAEGNEGPSQPNPVTP